MALHFETVSDYEPDFIEGSTLDDEVDTDIPTAVMESLVKQTKLYGTYFRLLLEQGFEREEAMFLLVTMIHSLNCNCE